MLDGDAIDTSGNSNNGILYGNPEITSDRYNNPHSALHFDGKIDDIRIYKRVLSKEEVLSLFDDYSID